MSRPVTINAICQALGVTNFLPLNGYHQS